MLSLQTVLDNLVDKNIIVFDGEILYQHFGLKKGDFDTRLVLVNGLLFERMHGFYKVMNIIGLPWSLLSVFELLPNVISDFLYNRVARNRYRIFGRRHHCLIKYEQIMSRFLD